MENRYIKDGQRNSLVLYLDGINVMGDYNQLCFLLLDKSGDVVDSVLEHDRFLRSSCRVFGPIGLLLCLSLEALFLLRFALRAVLVQQFEKLGS